MGDGTPEDSHTIVREVDFEDFPFDRSDLQSINLALPGGYMWVWTMYHTGEERYLLLENL